ncbi:eIF-3A like translation initiation factor [Cryptosporidium canis]|uniref:Eukaryotic translation initiation factor 2A n=1 Tax=Cryptosporidium canis TaxID=195482 RepID=A0A9D5DNM1_9CRYT|nr:eIF-3A like translation initiation factor [Cryptosporidium canis]
MSEPAGYDDEIICLGRGGVYRLREMARREVGPEELVVSSPAPFLEGVEIYAQEPQGRGYCYVPGNSKSSVVLVTALGDTGVYGEMVLENDFAVRKLQYSPLGSYLLVLTVYEQGRNENNLKVFKLKSEEGIFLLFSFPFKTNSAKVLSTWPPYRWSNDEVLVFKVQDTSVSIFRGDTESLENPIGTLNFSKSIQLSISNMVNGKSRESSLNFIVVTPQSSQNMDIFVYRAEMDDLKDIQLSSVGQLCISEAQSCQVSWNSQGDSALIFAQIEGETLGKSYFGSSSLHLVRMQNTKMVVASGVWGANSRTGPTDSGGGGGAGAGSASEAFRPSERWSLRHQVVVPPEEGPVNDVAWSPTSNEFLLCKGVIPPELTLNSGIDGSPKVSFGKSRRNTIRWNPSGRWFAYGGFGNLAGDLDIWDLDKQQLIGQTNASCCITLEWSVCGRFLLAATTSPRLRVDNAIRIFRYNGDLLRRVNFDTLYSAYWAPKTTSYRRSVQFRSVSPGREFNSKPQQEKQIYRPKWASSGFAEKMRAARDSNNVPTVVNVQQRPRNEYVIPGLPTLEASAAAAAASRSNQKHKLKK